jgi:hypothetical protein
MLMVAKVHPELLEQMAQAGNRPIQAVVHLRPAANHAAIPSPEESASLAQQVLERTAAQVGYPARKSNVLRNLACLIVEADPQFVQALLQQPEVVSALPNQTTENPFIPPVAKHSPRPR